MSRTAFRLGVLVCLTVMLLTSDVDAARRRSRSSSRNNAAAQKAARDRAIKAAQSQYASAQAVLNAAQMSGSGATARLQSVIAQMASAAQEMREATTELKELRKDLLDTEEDILAEQSADSPYVLLSNQITIVKKEIAEIEKRLLGSSEFIAKRSEVQVANGPIAVVKLRAEVLDSDPNYSRLKSKLDSLGNEIATLKHDLFENDPEWKAIHNAMIEAQKEERKALSEVYAHAPDRADPLRDIKDAKTAAAAAQNVMKQAENTLKKYGAGTTPTKTASKTNSSNKKKK